MTKLCARLDGLPLAIELAAARVRLFSPQALLVRLERSHGSSLQLLIDGPRDMPIRQQTLRNTIDWSYNLLGADEQTLFARLGVFVGGCTLEAVEAICIPDADLPSDVVHIIASLIEQSLVQLEEGEDGEPRFLMLETIREYALDRLEARGKAAVLQRRHAEYFCSLAESAEEPLYGPQAMAWANRLASEHNNLRAALRWALNQREIDIVGRTSGALHTFWSSSGYFSEGQQWQEMALKHGEQLLQLLRAKLLFQAGNLALAQGYYQEAAALSEAGLALARPFEDNPILVTALNMLGLVVLHREDIVQAEALFNEALTLARVHGNTRGSALALVYLSVIRLMQGDLTQAGKLAAESRLLFQQVEYTRYLALNIIVLGAITLFQGDIDKAMIMATEGLVLLQEVNEKQFMVYCLDLMAMIATARGQFVHATRLMGSANMLRETIGLRRIWGIELLVKRTVGTVQAHLDAAVFEAAWMEGRAMSLQQAITYTVTDSY